MTDVGSLGQPGCSRGVHVERPILDRQRPALGRAQLFARVAFDVAEDKISAEWARREYGVAIDPATGEVLAEETARLRSR